MKRSLVIVAFVLACSALFAKGVERVSATMEYTSDDSKATPEQVERIAIEKAKIRALEEKFGVDVSSIQSSYIKNTSDGNSRHSVSDMFSLGGTSVRGEWIETIKEEVLDKRYDHGFWVVKVHVEGRARSKKAEGVDIDFAFVNNSHDKISRESFYDGDNIYMTFSSPVSGSLCVYLIDENQEAFCLLPYENNNSGSQPIEANKNYLFFYQDMGGEEYMKTATEYELNTQKSIEQNALYVVFSPNKITKSNDRKKENNWRNQPLPRSLSYNDFMTWLSKNQTTDEQMIVRPIVISINRK